MVSAHSSPLNGSLNDMNSKWPLSQGLSQNVTNEGTSESASKHKVVVSHKTKSEYARKIIRQRCTRFHARRKKPQAHYQCSEFPPKQP